MPSRLCYWQTGVAPGKQVAPGTVKSATGDAAIVTVTDSGIALRQPLAVVTINVMVYVPRQHIHAQGFVECSLVTGRQNPIPML